MPGPFPRSAVSGAGSPPIRGDIAVRLEHGACHGPSILRSPELARTSGAPARSRAGSWPDPSHIGASRPVRFWPMPGARLGQQQNRVLVEVHGALAGPVQRPGHVGRVEGVLEGRRVGDAVEELAGDEEVVPLALPDVEPALGHHEQVSDHTARIIVHAPALEVPAEVPPDFLDLPGFDAASPRHVSMLTPPMGGSPSFSPPGRRHRPRKWGYHRPSPGSRGVTVAAVRVRRQGDSRMSHFFAYLSRLRFIRRWGLIHSAYPENVQEHSLRVAQIAHALAIIRNRLFGGDVDAERTAVLALYHDASEVLTGDLPTPIKNFNPEILR